MSIEVKISNKEIPYKQAITYLEERVESLKRGKNKELIWILEHPLTYTAGISWSMKDILDKDINVIETRRGGKITLHNPGQKVIYFALDLDKRKRNIRRFVSTIENSIIQVLKKYDIESKSDKKNIGIWVNKKKIAAIGIKVSKWIAYHGCSININNNLEDYKKINPCGLSNENITSIFHENKNINLPKNNEILKIFLKNFKSF